MIGWTIGGSCTLVAIHVIRYHLLCIQSPIFPQGSNGYAITVGPSLKIAFLACHTRIGGLNGPCIGRAGIYGCWSYGSNPVLDPKIVPKIVD